MTDSAQEKDKPDKLPPEAPKPPVKPPGSEKAPEVSEAELERFKRTFGWPMKTGWSWARIPTQLRQPMNWWAS